MTVRGGGRRCTFSYGDARAAVRSRTVIGDSTCAIAYWGVAISLRPNPLVGPFDAAPLERGLEAVEKGKAIGVRTPREP
jgi:hypothetical protein